jgi:hypothetical protein
MPKGPNGQKRPADAIGCAVAVGRIATGESDEEVAYATSKSEKASAGGKARAQHLSKDERSKIAKAGAEARWNKERRADMTNKERLMAALFDNPQREHVDIKFFLGGGVEITEEALCGEAVKMLEQMDAGVGDTEFKETFEQRDVSEFIATV